MIEFAIIPPRLNLGWELRVKIFDVDMSHFVHNNTHILAESICSEKFLPREPCSSKCILHVTCPGDYIFEFNKNIPLETISMRAFEFIEAIEAEIRLTSPNLIH